MKLRSKTSEFCMASTYMCILVCKCNPETHRDTCIYTYTKDKISVQKHPIFSITFLLYVCICICYNNVNICFNFLFYLKFKEWFTIKLSIITKLFKECFQNRFKLFFKGYIQYITRFANKTGGRWAAYTV